MRDQEEGELQERRVFGAVPTAAGRSVVYEPIKKVERGEKRWNKRKIKESGKVLDFRARGG